MLGAECQEMTASRDVAEKGTTSPRRDRTCCAISGKKRRKSPIGGGPSKEARGYRNDVGKSGTGIRQTRQRGLPWGQAGGTRSTANEGDCEKKRGREKKRRSESSWKSREKRGFLGREPGGPQLTDESDQKRWGVTR